MIFTPTQLSGVYQIQLQPHSDDRGFLARTWGTEEFTNNGIDFHPVQGYVTNSIHQGTIRGFHFLTVPEKKLTRVIGGSVYEVVIDIRPDSPTYRKWQAFTFKATDHQMLYMGPGMAHAILTLKNNTELMSWYSPAYSPNHEAGIRYNDPAFNIPWPIKVKRVSKKDLSWEDFK